jgi:2-methylcitrate dehydratase PrpD
MASSTRSRNLAAILAGLRLGDLPHRAVHQLKLCVLDHLGCAIGALGTDVGSAAIRAARLSGSGSCTVIGAGLRTNPETAALVNGTLSHVLVFDDLHRQAKLHPGVAVIPAALAAAERDTVSGSVFLTAVAAGYEAAARTGVAIGMSGHRAKGWRATGTCGSFGAATAAAVVMGADADVMHEALAMAAAQASGSWSFAASGGMELYLAAGTAARNGVTAAALAHCGFHGSADPLEAADGGFFTMTSGGQHPELLDEPFPRTLRLADTCIKMYPTCHSTQTGLDAVLNLRKRHAIVPEMVESIVVRAGQITMVQCGWPFELGPPSRMIFHMGYALAVALKRGKVRPNDFEAATLHDPELQRIARATQVVVDPELTAIYEQRKPCDVTLYLRDGRLLNERVDFCSGEPENPVSDAAVIDKFFDLTEGHLARDIGEKIIEFVLDIERRSDLSSLCNWLMEPAGVKVALR